MEIPSFSKISSFDYVNQQIVSIQNEIEGQSKEYILQVDQNDYLKYIYDKYELEPITINFDSESFNAPYKSEKVIEDRHYGEKFKIPTYTFTITYNFSGSSDIFYIRPSHWTLTSYNIVINERENKVSFSFTITKQDAELFKNTKEECKRSAFTNLANANKEAIAWNNQILSIATSCFNNLKAKLENENSFYASINLKVDSNKNNVFAAQTVTKKIIPQPTVGKKSEFSSEPTMAKETYIDVIHTIYNSGKNMEKKPSLYKDKDEESLRDQFLFVLESRYNGTTASGEAFNKDGKTDIMLKYAKDGSNLFIAECKIWKGAVEFHKAISQLFDRYLTWRDSKVSVIFFVQNTDFSSVLKTIKLEAKKHQNYVKENGSHGESSFSYIFNLPQDKDKEVYVEIMAFHYYQ
ncbi:MAG: hypothetical protein ACO1G9_05975 [Bacteroidota bacterium]